jgi:heme exporter protein D
MSEWLNMGGYALFVWSSWGLALLLLGGLTVSTVLGLRSAEKRASELGLDDRRRRGKKEAA